MQWPVIGGGEGHQAYCSVTALCCRRVLTCVWAATSLGGSPMKNDVDGCDRPGSFATLGRDPPKKMGRENGYEMRKLPGGVLGDEASVR